MRKSRWVVVAALAATSIVLGTLYHSPEPSADAPRILLSVDRTLWNRLGFNRLTYLRALRDAGLRPILIDFEAMQGTSQSARALLDGVDGLVLSGGGDVDPTLYGSETIAGLDVNRKRDEFELALLEAADERGLPVLGICRGAQLMNVYRGGTLNDMRADSPRYRRHHRIRSGHAIELQADSRLAKIFGETRLDEVVTFHGQFVDEPGKDVRVVGYAEDGTPEAIEVDTGTEFGMLGVQWHAEVLPWDAKQAHLFHALFEAAADYRANRG